MKCAFNKRHLAIVALTAILFRFLFIIWGWTGFYVLAPNTLTRIYFFQGYGICAGYGYVRPTHLKNMEHLENMAREHQRITPESVPSVSSDAFIPEMLHPPGMAVLAAAAHLLTSGSGYLAVEIFGGLLDAVAACLLYWLVATFFIARVGFTAAMLYALFPPLGYLSTVGKAPEGLLSVFIISSLACVLQSTRSKGWKRVAWWIGSGSLIGIGSYLRPDYLLMSTALGAGLWLYTRRFWQSVAAAVTLQAAAMLILFPWAYRNHELCGRWIFTSTSVGWTLVNGLGQYDNPWGIVGTDGARGCDAKRQGFSSPASSEADLYFRKVFWNSVKSSPQGYVMSVVKRAPKTINTPPFGYANPYEKARFSNAMKQGQDGGDGIIANLSYVLTANWDWILRGAVGLAGLLCSIYMLIRERRRFGLVFLLLSPHLYSSGTHVLTHAESRYLVPSVFSFLIGLAYVLCKGWKDVVPEQGPANATT